MHCVICGDRVRASKAHYIRDTVRNTVTAKVSPTKRPVCPQCAKRLKENQ